MAARNIYRFESCVQYNKWRRWVSVRNRFSPIPSILGSVSSAAIGSEARSIFPSVNQSLMLLMDMMVKSRNHYGTAIWLFVIYSHITR
jgi:hypothetical protein